MKYRAWLRDNESEEDGKLYVSGPGLAAEAHAEREYRDDSGTRGFVTIRVNVRRINDDGTGHDEVLVFDVNVEMEPHFVSSLRSTYKSKEGSKA